MPDQSGMTAPSDADEHKEVVSARVLARARAYLNQPRFLKYHIGTSALATISVSANG